MRVVTFGELTDKGKPIMSINNNLEKIETEKLYILK